MAIHKSKTRYAPPFPGMIIREKEPLNLEFPFPTLQGRITPTESFFIRCHFTVPAIKANSWKMKVTGEVEKELSISYAQLLKLPAKTITATLECAGNGRANLIPKSKGLLWEQGAVGNAEWTGVPLSVILQKARIKPGTIEIILEGADEGPVTEEPKSPGAISFARSLPLDKAMQDEVLIAYKMNGEDLTPEHGFPVRAIVPGWYGMCSVKWLTNIVASAQPYNGYWQTLEYAYWQRKNLLPTMAAVNEIQVKAEIARPAVYEVVAAGTTYRVFGAAWSGKAVVNKVEFSVDEGKTWHNAKLLDKPIPYTWQLWEYQWKVPAKAGRYKLKARATDSAGNTQPGQHDPDRRNYMINFTAPLNVDIK